METITRRKAIQTAAASAALAAVPALASGATVAVAAPNDDTPVMALFREWKAVGALADAADTDEEVGAYVDVASAIEKRMAATPSITARDMAAKIVALSDYGHSIIESDDLMDEACRLVEAM